MGEAGTTAVVVTLAGGALGIVTDRDLRSRVATGEVPVDAPVSAVMTRGRVHRRRPTGSGSDVLIDLLDRGVRHAPVVDGAGRVLGVLDDLDLLATEARGAVPAAPRDRRRARRRAGRRGRRRPARTRSSRCSTRGIAPTGSRP